MRTVPASCDLNWGWRLIVQDRYQLVDTVLNSDDATGSYLSFPGISLADLDDMLNDFLIRGGRQ